MKVSRSLPGLIPTRPTSSNALVSIRTGAPDGPVALTLLSTTSPRRIERLYPIKEGCERLRAVRWWSFPWQLSQAPKRLPKGSLTTECRLTAFGKPHQSLPLANRLGRPCFIGTYTRAVPCRFRRGPIATGVVDWVFVRQFGLVSMSITTWPYCDSPAPCSDVAVTSSLLFPCRFRRGPIATGRTRR